MQLCMGGSVFIELWTVLPEYSEPFPMRGIPNPKIVLPEHCEFALTGFYCYTTNQNWISTKEAKKISLLYLPITATV